MSDLTSQFEGKATSGETAVAVGSTYAVVIEPIDVQAYGRFTVYALNSGGGGGAAITSVVLETAPTSDSTVWVTVDEVLAADLTSNKMVAATYVDQSLKFVRLRAKTTASTSTARFWFCAGGYVG